VAALALLWYYWDDVAAAGRAAWETLKAAGAAALGWLSSAVGWYLDLFTSVWGGIFSFLKGIVIGIADLFGMGDLAKTFFDAGAALWGAFTGGIRAFLSSPAAAVEEGLAAVRNLLPFSDAKTGPLSQLTENGRRLMATIGEGVRIEAPNFAATVSHALDFDKFPDRERSEAGGGSGRQIVVQGNIIIQVEKLDNPDDLAGALKEFALSVGG
jgi:hypothetical protein